MTIAKAPTPSSSPAPARRVAEMAAYALAEAPAGGGPIVALAQNECLRAPSPKAIVAARDAAAACADYPDPDWRDLRRAIAGVHDLDPGRLLIGAGSMELIAAVAMAYLSPGDAALTTEHGYLFFRTAAMLAGGRVDLAPERERVVDVNRLATAIRPETRIVFVANPGNPTGTSLPRTELHRLREALPRGVLLVVDEAYGEFVDAASSDCFDLVARGDTVVLRTFSKAYGLAGMRVGWGVFPSKVASETRKALNPNNVSGPAQAAAAAAMRDQTYMRETVALTSNGRDAFIRRARALGLAVDDSHANFALVGFASADAAATVEAALRRDGVIVRAMGGYGLSAFLRVTIGPPEAMDVAAESLTRAVQPRDA